MANKAQQASFDRTYLDTEPMTVAEWTHVSGRLEALLSVASNIFHLPVYLPVAADAELEAQYMREYEAAAKALIKAPKPVKGLLFRLQHPTLRIDAPSAADIRARYRASRR